MINKLLLSIVAVLLLCSPGNAGWFGPSNFDECILESMKGVTSDIAARSIYQSCRKKFPENQKVKHSLRKLSLTELSQISGRAGLSFNNYYAGNLYNGNDCLTITQVTINISTSSSETNFSRAYSVDVEIPPLKTENFGISIVVGDVGAEYHWDIISAQGY